MNDDNQQTGEEGKPGPEPERLKLDEDDWREAVRKVLKGKKPGEERNPEDEGQEGEED